MSMPKIGHTGSKEVSLILLEETVASKMGLHTFVCNCKAAFLTPYMATHHVKKKHADKSFKECMTVNMDFLNEKCRIMHWERFYIEVSNNIYQNLERVIGEQVKTECANLGSEVQSSFIPQTSQDANSCRGCLKRAINYTEVSLQKKIKTDFDDDSSSDSTLKASDSPTTPCDALSVSSEVAYDTTDERPKSSLARESAFVFNIKKEPTDYTEDASCSSKNPRGSPDQLDRSTVSAETNTSTPTPCSTFTRENTLQAGSLWDVAYEDMSWRTNSKHSASATISLQQSSAVGSNADFPQKAEVVSGPSPSTKTNEPGRDLLAEVFHIRRDQSNPVVSSSLNIGTTVNPCTPGVGSASSLPEQIQNNDFSAPGSLKDDTNKSPPIPTDFDSSRAHFDPRFAHKYRSSTSSIYGRQPRLKRELEIIKVLVEEVRRQNQEDAQMKEEYARKMKEDAKKKAGDAKKKEMMQNLYSRAIKKKPASNVESNDLSQEAHSSAASDAYNNTSGRQYPPFHLAYDPSTLHDANNMPTPFLLNLCSEFAQWAYNECGDDWVCANSIWMNTARNGGFREEHGKEAESPTHTELPVSYNVESNCISEESVPGSLVYGPENCM